jgi:hypothetical protein
MSVQTRWPGVLIDTVPLPVRLLLLGTGPEIEPITQLAGNLGWVVECFDHPSELRGLAGSERRHCSPLDCRNQWQVEGQHRIQHIPAVRAFDIYG